MLNQFRDYLTARRRSPETIRIRMVYLRQLAATCDLETATLNEFESFIHSHPEWKPETVNAAVTSIRVFYRWAHRRGLVVADPTEHLELVHVPRRVKTLADDDRLREVLGKTGDREQAMIRLGREAGLRRAEIASLHMDSRDGNWLTVTGKGNRTRRLHITGPLLAVLVRLETSQEYGFYFPGRGVPHVRPEYVYRTVLRLTGTPTHALRRRAATSVYRQTGNDIRTTQEFLGHSSPVITAIYVDVPEESLVLAGNAASLEAA